MIWDSHKHRHVTRPLINAAEMEDLLDTIRQKKAARSLSLRLWCYFEGLWVWLPWWRCSIRKTHWHYITALSKRRRRSISVIMITSVIMMLARDWSVITAAGFSVGPQLLSLVQCEAAWALQQSHHDAQRRPRFFEFDGDKRHTAH